MLSNVQTSSVSVLRLIQFRAGYNLPVHVAIEMGHFARSGLQVDVTYTPGSQPFLAGLKAGQFEIGYAAADDLVADVESPHSTHIWTHPGMQGDFLRWHSLVAPIYTAC